MRRFLKFVFAVPAVLIVGTAACDNTQNLTAPQQKVSAQFASNAGPRRVVATVSPAHNSAVIDTHGGSIQVENLDHQVIAMLVIPGGAVQNNTTFTIDISP